MLVRLARNLSCGTSCNNASSAPAVTPKMAASLGAMLHPDGINFPRHGAIEKYSFQPPATSEIPGRRTPVAAMAPAMQVQLGEPGVMFIQPCVVIMHC